MKGIMKKRFMKLVALTISLLLLYGAACADSFDYSTLSSEELHAMLDGVRNELLIREIHAGGETVLLDQDGVFVYLDGTVEVNHSKSGGDYLHLGVVVVNNTDKQVSIRNIDGCVHVNGWEIVSGGVDKVDPGKRKADEFLIKLNNAKISTLEEVEEIEFEIFAYEGTDQKSIITQGEEVTIHFN